MTPSVEELIAALGIEADDFPTSEPGSLMRRAADAIARQQRVIEKYERALMGLMNLVRPLLDKPYGIAGDEDAIRDAREALAEDPTP